MLGSRSSSPSSVGRRLAEWLGAPGAGAPAEAAAGAPPAELVALQRRALRDADTGLLLRPAFLARLQAALADPLAPPIALLLLRSPHAEALSAYHDNVPGAFAGQLEEGLAALVLPTVGVAEETAASLAQALKAMPASREPLAIGAADGLQGLPCDEAVARATRALGEAAGAGGVVVHREPACGLGDARAWRARIADALEAGRVDIAGFPVVGRDGALLRLECPARIQFEPQAPWRPAREWLAQAARSRLVPRVDLAAVDRALAAIASDGVPRSVHVSAASMAEPGFADAVCARLRRAPRAARALGIDWLASRGLGAADRVAWQAVARRWHRMGASVGLAHADLAAQTLAPWREIGIARVKIDAGHWHGVGDGGAGHAYAKALVAAVHGLGALAMAEGVADTAAVQRLLDAGFDAVTGPAVRHQSMSPT
jgi:EAL domain-containing protein (putative c-di-GMP-specific phosphodiesterase class I)